MRDHEFPPLEKGPGGFEKQVHQKLSEMELSPPAAIWERLDERLHPKNKRRPWIVWLPLLLVAFGISSYLVWNSVSSSNNNKTTPVTKTKPNNIENKNTLTPHINKEPLNARKSTQIPDGAIEKPPPAGEGENAAIVKGSEHSPIENNEGPRKIAASRLASQAATKKTVIVPATGTSHAKGNIEGNIITGQQKLNLPQAKAENIQPGIEEMDQGNETPPGSIKELKPALVIFPALPGNLINTSLGLQNESRLAGMSPVKLKRTPAGISWGFMLQGGRSSANDGSINSLFQSSAIYDANASFAQSNANASANYRPPSSLEPGPAFSAGLFVRRQLTRRISFSAGLNYTLLTLSNQVGTKVDSAIILPSTLARDQKAIEEYYRLGSSHKYINKYHFIEVPVLLRAKLFASERIPLYVDLGFSIARLVSTNALHFDASSRIYYSNIDLFNRTQVNLVTGLPIRFFSKSKFSVEAGPQLQYGITNLLANQRTGGKHMLFVGLKAGILMGKK